MTKRVLIIDDDPEAMRKMVAVHWGDTGIKVAVARVLYAGRAVVAAGQYGLSWQQVSVVRVVR